jgi:uncharacterized membrane protein
MDTNGRQKAQQRVDRIAAFRAELAELEREHGLLLTPEQRASLNAHLEGVLAALSRQSDLEGNDSARRISSGMRVASLLGAAAFYAALVLFLHRIWGLLPPFAHVLLLVAPPLLLLAAADWLFHRGLDRFYTGVLVLAAGAGFVMGLTALGDTFNQAPSPHALFAWAAFALLVAYAYGLRLLLVAGLLLGCAYTAALWMDASGGYWPGFLQRAATLIPATALCYLVPGLKSRPDPHGFDFLYRLCGGAMLLTALLILSKRGDLCCSGLPARTLEGLYQLAGMGLSAGVVFHGLRLDRSGLVNLGAAGFVVFLFVRLHAWWWHWMPKYLFCLLLGLIAVGLLLVFRRMRARLSARVGL